MSLKVYDILTPFNYSQKNCVVAENMAKAESIFLTKYGTSSKILEIKLHAEFVEIQTGEKEAKI